MPFRLSIADLKFWGVKVVVLNILLLPFILTIIVSSVAILDTPVYYLLRSNPGLGFFFYYYFFIINLNDMLQIWLGFLTVLLLFFLFLELDLCSWFWVNLDDFVFGKEKKNQFLCSFANQSLSFSFFNFWVFDIFLFVKHWRPKYFWKDFWGFPSCRYEEL